MAKKSYKIPFNVDGNLMCYAEDQYYYIDSETGEQMAPSVHYNLGSWEEDIIQDKSLPPEWRDNYEFDVSFAFLGFGRGPNAAYAILEDEDTGRKYYMLLTDFENVIQMGCVSEGYFAGTWTFVERGANFRVKLI